MFITEPHLHVAEISPCADLHATEAVKAYHAAGYRTLIVTDHFNTRFVKYLGALSWQEKMTVFLSGYFRAKEYAAKYGMNVLLGAEFGFEGFSNHYLAYGLTREFLNEHEGLDRMTAESFSAIARAAGILLVQAHPYREGGCFPTPAIVDGAEVYNSNPRHEDFNDRAEAIAAEHRLIRTAGSDTHRPEDVGRAGICSEKEIRTMEDFTALLRSGDYTLYKKEEER